MKWSHGSLRLTIAERISKEDIDYLLSVLPNIVKRLRSMSPLAPKGGLSHVQ